MNKELRAKSDQELIELVARLKGQLLQYRFKQAQGEMEKLHLIRQTKRLLARIYTILNERNVAVNLSAQLGALGIGQHGDVKRAEAEAKEKLLQKKSERKKRQKTLRDANRQKVAAAPRAEKPKTQKRDRQKPKAAGQTRPTKAVRRKAANKTSSRSRMKGAK